MIFPFISIIHFMKKSFLCQPKSFKAKKQGFLLIEILYALTIALLLYMVSLHWQHSIKKLHFETVRGFKALHVAHETLERCTIDSIWLAKKEYIQDDIKCSWRTESVYVKEIKMLPPLRYPKNFKLLIIDIEWPGIKDKQKVSFTTGVITNA